MTGARAKHERGDDKGSNRTCLLAAARDTWRHACSHACKGIKALGHGGFHEASLVPCMGSSTEAETLQQPAAPCPPRATLVPTDELRRPPSNAVLSGELLLGLDDMPRVCFAIVLQLAIRRVIACSRAFQPPRPQTKTLKEAERGVCKASLMRPRTARCATSETASRAASVDALLRDMGFV